MKRLGVRRLKKAVVNGQPYRIAPDNTVYRLTHRGELRAVPKRVQVWVLQEHHRQERKRRTLPDRLIQRAEEERKKADARRKERLAFLRRRRRRRILAGVLAALVLAAACYVAWTQLSTGATP